MTKEPITFDKLPQAVSYLTEQVEKIYQLVETLQPQKLDHQHQLIDIDKASILIQKSKPTIYRLARTGLIPTHQLLPAEHGGQEHASDRRPLHQDECPRQDTDRL